METQQQPANTDASMGQTLQRLADEARVKVHLATQEAKDAWHALEPRVHEYQRRAKESAGKLSDDLHNLGKDLETRLRALVDYMRK